MNRLMKTKWKQLGILALCTVLLFTSACDRTGQKETEQNSEAESQGSSGDQDRAQALADGKYEIEVTLSGGSGRATVDSPCELTVSGGQMTARIEWSSPNYDYMLVDGEKYLPVNTEGNSVFEIPVAVLDEEIPVAALRHVAVADAKFKEQLAQSVKQDDTSVVKMTQYKPNNLTYEVKSSKGGVIVFSEIYYPGWTATVDGQPAELGRVNYILRALNVKAGNHKVVLDFHPQSLKNTETVAYIGYGVLALLIIIGVVVEVRKRKKE